MSNIFRPVYRELNEKEKKLVDDIKTKAQELYDLMGECINEKPSPKARHVALARTSLEESVMWVVKAITT